MSESVKMPALGESVTEGTVTRWLKQVGESVEVDEPLLEVSTDKVDTEVPSPVAGVVEKILVDEDETVEVGAELAVIGDGSGAGEPEKQSVQAEDDDYEEPAPEPSAPSPEPPPAEEPAPSAPSPQAAPTPSAGSGQAVTMPALGESVTEGTITRWLKAEGDSVEEDEPLLEVSTDKVDTEVPSPFAGTLLKILVGEDETAEVGTELALIGEAGAAAPEEEPAQEAPAKPAETEKAAETEKPAEKEKPAEQEKPAEKPDAAAQAGGSYVTPIVRKLAKDKDVDLSAITGTGVGGRIRKEDVLEAARKAEEEKKAAEERRRAEEEKAVAPAATPAPEAAKPAPKPAAEPSPLRGTTEKMSRLRKVIAKRMVESMQTSAQLTTVIEVDVTRVATLRAKSKSSFPQREGVNLTFLPFFVKAATEALKAHPKINASIVGEEVQYHGAEHIGIAVDTERGLLVPVIKDAGDLNIPGIAKRIADLAARTRSNKVLPDELSGSTFTITNTGSGGALFDTPIINQPEVAILGVGTIVKRPMVVKDAEGNENIGIRSMCYLALSYDHRLVDGADAARYLMAVKARLEEGSFEGDLG
ncbi:MAG: 2-oxoglutarate dehydrogenase, E2 component, dihydrolipoamide succinyltransferase [Actinomycetes bacterium]|nr:2-oxoglutarate dehydrogenase, E2 component, dihydrolipoamide succinyltransferase [Actinomycetes bacterium]MDX5380119.1 2-oxoglutarate dehydrogenase, E2 component, dihydrolipoamide succinyltransferase [Actinomycetes bacterium]MDX5398722.1 2-oxoglutarate dehydrogenase, E2 component, dihydrolipoamide succinyltransferase [Actinomycetes bacterium]